ncbi:MAG: TIGR02301 family protein [Robiginitomaculum sp.]
MKFFLPLLLIVHATPSLAQDAKSLTATKAFEQADNRIDKNMVTMSNLVEAMANNLGQLHYLRTLCFPNDNQTWRVTASKMMAIEVPKDSARRRELIRAFNTGYYEQKSRYQKCDNTVAVDVAALSENGRRLATMLGDPYRER